MTGALGLPLANDGELADFHLPYGAVADAAGGDGGADVVAMGDALQHYSQHLHCCPCTAEEIGTHQRIVGGTGADVYGQRRRPPQQQQQQVADHRSMAELAPSNIVVVVVE